MSRPVHAVSSDDEISAALVECQRLGLSGIQVSDDGDLTGVVAREDLDRAVRHGLSHAPVKARDERRGAGGGEATRRSGSCATCSPAAARGRLVVVPRGPYRTEERVPLERGRGRRHAAATCCARCTSR